MGQINAESNSLLANLRRVWRLDGVKEGPIWIESESDEDISDASSAKDAAKFAASIIDSAIGDIGKRLEEDIPRNLDKEELELFNKDRPRFLASILAAYRDGLISGLAADIEDRVKRHKRKNR